MKAVDRADMIQVCWPLSLKQPELEDMIISAENVQENEKMHVIDSQTQFLNRCTTFDGSMNTEGIKTRNAAVVVAVQQQRT